MSEELAGQADVLKDTIGFFKISDDAEFSGEKRVGNG